VLGAAAKLASKRYIPPPSIRITPTLIWQLPRTVSVPPFWIVSEPLLPIVRSIVEATPDRPIVRASDTVTACVIVTSSPFPGTTPPVHVLVEDQGPDAAEVMSGMCQLPA
jgi:hypothetical protein